MIRNQPPTASPDPSTVIGKFTEIVADAEGKLPGQIWDSNAAAPVAKTEEAATTTNPPTIAFPLLAGIVILKTDLIRDESAHDERSIVRAALKAYAHRHENQNQ